MTREMIFFLIKCENDKKKMMILGKRKEPTEEIFILRYMLMCLRDDVKNNISYHFFSQETI